MKNLIFTLVLFVTSITNAQFFNNSNGELCFELYQTQGAFTKNVVYLVFDERITKLQGDQLIAEWNKLTNQQQYNATQRFSMDGRRVETEVLEYFHPTKPVFLAAKPDSWENHLKPLNPKKK
jgi:hypothetical protein